MTDTNYKGKFILAHGWRMSQSKMGQPHGLDAGDCGRWGGGAGQKKDHLTSWRQTENS